MTFHYRPRLYFLRQAECVFHWFSWIGCPESLRDLPVFPSQHWAYRHMREGTHQAFHMSAGDPDAGQAGTANSLWVNSLAPRLHWFMHFPARGGSWLEPSYTGHRSTGASLELIYILASSHMGGRFWGSKLPGCFPGFHYQWDSLSLHHKSSGGVGRCQSQPRATQRRWTRSLHPEL